MSITHRDDRSSFQWPTIIHSNRSTIPGKLSISKENAAEKYSLLCHRTQEI